MSVGFPIGLIAAIVFAVLLLGLIGIILWHVMFASESQFQRKGDTSKRDSNESPNVEATPASSPDTSHSNPSDTEIQPEAMDSLESLQPKTVSGEDTISNDCDIELDVAELQKRLSNQPTVENAGDVSISNDDTEE